MSRVGEIVQRIKNGNGTTTRSGTRIELPVGTVARVTSIDRNNWATLEGFTAVGANNPRCLRVATPQPEQVKGMCTGCVYKGINSPHSDPIRSCTYPESNQGARCARDYIIYGFPEHVPGLEQEVAKTTSSARSNDPATSKGKRRVNKYEQAVLGALAYDKATVEGTVIQAGLNGKEIALHSGHPLNCITPRFAPLRRKGLIAPLYSEGYGHHIVKRDKQIVWVLA